MYAPTKHCLFVFNHQQRLFFSPKIKAHITGNTLRKIPQASWEISHLKSTLFFFSFNVNVGFLCGFKPKGIYVSNSNAII